MLGEKGDERVIRRFIFLRKVFYAIEDATKFIKTECESESESDNLADLCEKFICLQTLKKYQLVDKIDDKNLFNKLKNKSNSYSSFLVKHFQDFPLRNGELKERLKKKVDFCGDCSSRYNGCLFFIRDILSCLFFFEGKDFDDLWEKIQEIVEKNFRNNGWPSRIGKQEIDLYITASILHTLTIYKDKFKEFFPENIIIFEESKCIKTIIDAQHNKPEEKNFKEIFGSWDESFWGEDTFIQRVKSTARIAKFLHQKMVRNEVKEDCKQLIRKSVTDGIAYVNNKFGVYSFCRDPVTPRDQKYIYYPGETDIEGTIHGVQLYLDIGKECPDIYLGDAFLEKKLNGLLINKEMMVRGL